MADDPSSNPDAAPSDTDGDGAATGGESSAQGNEARRAGRGGLAIAAAKIYFIFVGLAQQIVLKHVLGLQSYGALGRVQSLASVVYNPIISTSVQGVSRAVSAAPDDERDAAERRVLSMHALALIPVAGGFALAAPWIADAVRAPHLALPLRIISIVVLAYGLYTPLVGAINGRKRFGWQALLDVIAATLRTVGLLGGAYWLGSRGLGVEGALGGFAAAACLMVGIALAVNGAGKRGRGGPTVKQHLAFVAPLLAGQIALNMLFQSDLTLLGRFAADAAVLSDLDVKQADTLAGAYRNAQLYCFLPYQLLLSITFVLFPLLAGAQRDGDREAVALYVRTGLRLALIIAGLLVSVTAGLPAPLLNLVFGADSAALAADAMTLMSLGLGSFAVFGILVTVLTSLKRERLSALLTWGALGLVVVLCFALVRGQPFGPGMLLRTAIATGSGLVTATIMAAVAVRQTAGALVGGATLLRVLIALAVAAGLARWLPMPSKLMTLVYAAAVGVVYLLMLVITRELNGDDAAMLRRLIKR